MMRSTTDRTRASVKLGIILASRSRTRISVTPGLERSANSKACNNSSRELLALLLPRYLFDSCLKNKISLNEITKIIKIVHYVRQQRGNDSGHGVFNASLVMVFCVRLVSIVPAEILDVGWDGRCGLLVTSTAMCLLLLDWLPISISLSLRFVNDE